MREGIEVRLRPGDRERLEGMVADRKSPEHHVWRARIVLLTAALAVAIAQNERPGRVGSGCGLKGHRMSTLP